MQKIGDRRKKKWLEKRQKQADRMISEGFCPVDVESWYSYNNPLAEDCKKLSDCKKDCEDNGFCKCGHFYKGCEDFDLVDADARFRK